MKKSVENHFLSNAIKLFKYYKSLGDKTLEQIPEENIHKTINKASNSVAIIVKHISGNMRSRWTDFLTSDGEKSWRNRDGEFEDTIKDKKDLLEIWEKGWACLFEAIEPLEGEDATKIIYIRNEGHTVLEAMQRQLGHYSYHVGQLVFLGKYFCGDNWKSLSIPKNKSGEFNQDKFSKEKTRKFFTDEK